MSAYAFRMRMEFGKYNTAKEGTKQALVHMILSRKHVRCFLKNQENDETIINIYMN